MFQELKNKTLLDNELRDLIVPMEKVAHVQLKNPLEHALLVLIKSGYTVIPVLDPTLKLHGIISNSLILDSLLGVEQFELERLSDQTVSDVMNTNVPMIKKEDTFARALNLSINHPFLCVVNDEQEFLGILTRRSILALVSKYLHTQEVK
ncbi:cyclic-di-AMP-binding protein CbpB [Alkalihalobacillus pseudalcaliphilus]|uniref:cyclic-di-AMP-binding protein CbpB n=1 Tax=Alkalihalobacillus pseudalcaliphilus TaxID=79884 RepID=UPI00064DFBDD|nr:cyclic-di-AMP-binding protein CbpB [Alkalihalobacillus pseudalcaliphilus]KMK76046.1 CBS domain-containing protein YkuL [Alkalihalobacillus pseudalcaliphilus]